LNNLTEPQYKIVHLQNTILNTRSIADRFILTKDNDIMEILNIAHTKINNEVVLVGKVFLIKLPFYEKPLSSIIFDIYIVDNLSTELSWIPLKNLKKKVMILDNNSQKIVIPILHSSE